VKIVIDYEAVKEISKAIRKNHKIVSKSYGYCCMTDYFEGDRPNEYVCAKIFKGGLNNNFHRDVDGWGYFDTFDSVYWMWNVSADKLDAIIETMQSIADKYGYVVIKPEDEYKCIELKANA